MSQPSFDRGSAAPVPRSAPRSALAVIGDAWTGVGYARFFQPFEHLRRRGWDLRTLGRELTLVPGADGPVPESGLLDGAELLMFPQAIAAPRLADGSRVRLVAPLCAEARRRGVPVVWSVDDYLPAIRSANPSFERVNDVRDDLALLADAADALIVTTPALERSLRRLGAPIHVIPNAVDPARWRRRPQRSGGPRVGWAGSSSHVEDLRMIVPALTRLRRRVPFTLVLYGLVEMELDEQAHRIRADRARYSASQRRTAESFLELHAALRPLEPRHVPFGDMTRFFDVLPQLDLEIGLCPLLDDEFNRHKSALKAYEYAMCGSLAVASDVEPYRGEVTVTVANDPAAWCETLERYLRDPRARERELAAQREYVLAQRNIETLRDRWAEVLDRILEGR